ncbi:Transposon Ty3-I Gag-Pol polyprotein [Gossypium australe]|uniref:Transposon Ty3-I Gag-Pol polyprotein n=1 Tax=Gossypium australe TaxID=47621 RepID=A0A5B6W8E9_9ROSI|nr:Transposon Ty3-I Gag-Pol polyprotein [Gossypium australe]
MPNYTKLMKDILSKKRRLGEFEIVGLTKRCTTVLMIKLPLKLKDPGNFSIPYSIGNHYVGKALCDLRVIINVIPPSIFRKLGIGKARPTMVTLQLADRCYAHQKVKLRTVDKFIFPVDFLILDCEADKDVSIIIGRPFLAQVTFNVFNALKYADENEECRPIDLIGVELEEEFTRFFHNWACWFEWQGCRLIVGFWQQQIAKNGALLLRNRSRKSSECWGFGGLGVIFASNHYQVCTRNAESQTLAKAKKLVC